MSSKNSTDVIINGKIYTLSGYESTEYLQKVAAYIDSKYTELKTQDSFKRQSYDDQRTLIELNIADDYFKAKKQADTMDNEKQSKDQQIYDIKHELIAAQIEVESAKKEIFALQNELNEARMNIVRLETELNEASSQTKKRKTSSRNTSENDNQQSFL